MSTCHRILLSGTSGFRVHYCQAHQTVELEIGAMSLRLEEEALLLLGDSLQSAIRQLQAIQASRQSFEDFMRQFNRH